MWMQALFVLTSSVCVGMLVWAAAAEMSTDRHRRFEATMQQVAPTEAPRLAMATEWDVADRATTVSKFIERMPWTERLQLQLLRAGWVMRPSEFLAYTAIGSAALAGVLMLLLKSILALPIGLLAGCAVTYVHLKSTQAKRNHAISNQLPDVLDMLATAVRAGFSFSQGMSRVQAQTMPPISQEFGRTLEEVQLGRSLSDALETMVARTDNYDLALVVSAVQTQLETGGNMAEVLAKISSMIRERVRLQGEINVASSEGRFSAVILIALPIGLTLLLRVMSPAYLQPLVTTGEGKLMIVAAVTLLISGALILRRLVAIRV